MDPKVILSKAITLIYRTRLVNTLENDDLIRTIISTIKTENSQHEFNGRNCVKDLKEYCLELLNEKEPIAKEVIIQQLKLVLSNEPKLLQVTVEAIDQEYDDATNKRIITSIIKSLNNYYRENTATELLNKVSYELKFNRSKIPNFSEYLKDTIAQLEPLTLTITSMKDPAVVNEVDFENSENLIGVLEDVKSINNNTSIYKSGWQALNRMTQGGFRRGEFCTIGALQHKYKTGFSLSVFMQIARHNKPIIAQGEENKKPLLLRISFEDSLTNNVQFMYQYLKAHEGTILSPKDFNGLSTKEMGDYIVSDLTKNGFYIKMMRVDPSQWTYSSVINKIIELEAQGYCIHILMLDYITLLPTTGCSTGPIGFDKKDLVRRIRNFCSAKNIGVITPMQLSSEAKMLVRNGVPEHQLVNEVAERGYYDGTKSIDQDIDLELFIHLFSHKRKKYLAVRRGKHRIPTVIDDDDKYFILKFPGLNIPILEDITGDDTSMKTLPKDSDIGSGSLIDEVLA